MKPTTTTRSVPLFKTMPWMAALILIYASIYASKASSEEYEQLLIFTQPQKSDSARIFETAQLVEIRKIASQMGVALHILNADQGTPSEVALTPLLVYQNHRGRSIYQGRTTTPERIRNFIRTARFVPQGEAPNLRQDIPVRQIGRTRIWAPLKISAVTGTPPPDYDDQAFQKEARESILNGFKSFKLAREIALGRADRGFYMDFYPWRADDGTLFLSLALYSQFHCKAPIFEKKKPPLVGPWKERRRLFQEAAALMEAAIEQQIADGASGDAFNAVDRQTAIVDWQALGFPLPAAKPRDSGTQAAADAKLVQRWQMGSPGPDEAPLIQFRFPAPLDNYTGLVQTVDGNLVLGENLTLRGAQGAVRVDTRQAITMGDPVLDEAIQGSALLAARKFPEAVFVIETIASDGRPLTFGQLHAAQVSGRFTLKGKTLPLSLVGQFEPVIGVTGETRLLATGAFEIDLRRFNIEGADGPEPARHTLQIDLNLQFKPL